MLAAYRGPSTLVVNKTTIPRGLLSSSINCLWQFKFHLKSVKMATAAFKSNSKRSNDYVARVSPKSNPRIPNPPPPEKQRLRRSLSVNALSRSMQIDISSEFLNKRDNPLYWATGTADNNTQTPTLIAGVALQRGRSVNKKSDLKNGGQKEEIAARRRSLSRVNHNGNVRRGRSISRAKLGSQSETGQESRIAITYGGRSTTDKPFERRSSHPSRHPSVGSYLDSQVLNWEDGISTGSLSEAEEKTVKAVYEQMKSFEGDMLRKDAASSEIYETVRSEVRRAIADIQDDLQDAIRRTSTDVFDISPKLVKPEAVELVLDIRREYAKELEVSHERARKLRSDLAIEEHRKQELSRILKETLSEPKTSSSHRSRLGRKSSSERKMSKRLIDEAMSYFDECVSISTFDSSDFSAAEDLSVNSTAVTSSPTVGPTAGLNHCIKQMIHGNQGSSSVADSTSNVLVIDDNKKRDKKFCFSFDHKPMESVQLQHDFQNYIKTFEKDKGIDGISFQRSRDKYDVDAYNVLDVNERLLFDKVFIKNHESGSLHICGGVAVPFLPLFHLF